SARAALDFDDLEQGTRALLTENAAVRARYRTEFKHLLVDEFQDTNRAQWDIVRALLPDDARGLFVVGDPKQSIYAFRGADVTVFEAARATVTAANGDIVALSESYRTHKHLIDLFNELFGQLLVRATPDALYQVEYGDRMTAFRPTTGEPPHVYLDLGVHPHRGDGTDDERAANHRRREAARIAAWIGARIAEARPIYDKAGRAYRPIQYGDFAVLFRRMTNVTLYEEAFKAAGLPYVTVAGRGFYDRQEVWDILNLLRALVNPADELALATALRSPLFNLSDEALFALRLAARDEPPVSLWDALGSPPSLLPDSERETVAFAAACLRDLRATAGRVTIAELLGDLMARTGYLATLTALPDGGRRRGNVEKLIAKARDGGRITLGSFTRYLQDLSARELREGEAALDVSGAIQLMTIHASKGLEFPAVVLADSGAKVGGRDDALLSVDPPACRVYDDAESKIVTTGALQMAKVRLEAREDAESRRLLYVAATRAADMLLISGQTTQGKDGALSPTGWLAWLCAALALDTLALDAPLALDGRWAGVVVSGYDAERDAPLEAQSLQLKPAETQISIQPTLMGLKSLAGLAAPPALLAPVKLRRTAMARALTATQIADLGCAFDIEDERERAYYRERWRRAVLRDAPSRIDTIQGTGRRYNARVLGEIVHRALRWWRKNTTRTEWAAALDAYAWDEGVIDADARDDLVNKAWTLLQNVTSTPLHQRIERAQQVYREVPFIYRTDQRQITGVIDVLLLTAENRWQIVDYKTASVPNWIAFEQHARRYHIQVGVYAAAALQLLDPSGTVAKVPVEVYIHYIRYATTVKIETGAWQGALTRLEPCIGELINEDG
ncbi:MAG: 3'-5' exonuclease, partial [Chloroflexota bacterium]|nr:3'-5' exonuclease [Chloroflexota bacterium]